MAARQDHLAVSHARKIEFRIGGADLGFGKAERPPDYVGPLDQGDAFVIRDAARQPRSAETKEAPSAVGLRSNAYSF